MITQAEKPSVLLVDALNPDFGHPVDDDLFMAECIAPLADRFLVVTSPGSAANLRQRLQVPTQEIQTLDNAAPFPRGRLLRIALSLPSRQFRDVVFQSFEEVTTLLFMMLHPRTRVHLILTGNLRPDRLKRRPRLGRFFLRAVFRRAASVVVHSQREIQWIRKLVPGIDPGKLFIEPHHQMGLARDRVSWQEKKETILFLGPECPHKQASPVVDLIKRDRDKRYRYVLCGMRDIAPDLRSFLESQENVDLMFGRIADDDYYRLFREAALVILTHDHGYEGVASGAFLDAIACGTAVIARDMSPHTEHFSRFGPMGFLADYSDSRWCEDVLNCDLAARHEEFQQNMAALRKACSMEEVRAVLRAAFDRA